MEENDKKGMENPAFELQENGNPSNNNNNLHQGRVVGKVQVVAADELDNPEDCSLFGLVKLPFCRVFLTAQWILVFLCWASTIQGMVINGYINVGISSIEKRFNLQSTQSGIIVGCYDIGSILATVPVAYFGGRLGSSKPKYIAIGLFLMGCGSFFFSLPHFVSGQYELNSLLNTKNNETNYQLLCNNLQANERTEKCVEGNLQSLSTYRFFFIIGQLIHGIGAAPLVTLGTTLLDESVSKRNSPMYIGIFQTMFVIGPAIGYIAGGRFLDIYTDFDTLTDEEMPSIDPNSQLWIGAWWIGFVIGWILAWVCAFCISLYPSVLPGAEHHNQVNPDDGFVSLKELPKALKALLTNPCYLSINFGGAMDGFIIACLSTFMPKYMQYQFGLSSGLAAMTVGAIVVPGGGGGTFLGGYLTKRLQLSRSGVIKLYLVCQILVVPMIFIFFLFCPSLDFAGINKFEQHLDMPCNSECACSEFNYNPVCGKDSIIYFNPCYAGCKEKTSVTELRQDNRSSSENEIDYHFCSCVSEVFEQQASNKLCESDCKVRMILFLVGAFIMILFTFASTMPSLVATLRSVEPVHRSLGVGVGTIFARVFGTIPGPVLFGFLIDKACLLWERDECETDSFGSCLFYDNKAMAMNMLLVIMVVKIMAIFFFSMGYFFSERSPIKDE